MAGDHVRLFRADPRHRSMPWIHEQILPALRVPRADVRWADAAVRHVGYRSGPPPAETARDLPLVGEHSAV